MRRTYILISYLCINFTVLMATNLFDSIIFGPIQSRRLGVSLGVNLLPTDYKVCTFDCVYCECGFTPSHYVPSFEPEEKVVAELESVLKNRKEKNEPLDVITFAGNGEPTMHPKFASIIEKTIELRNLYFPDSQISVLSNATMLNRQSVVDALKKVDNNILKIDAGINATAKIIDRPDQPFSASNVPPTVWMRASWARVIQ